MCHIFDVTNSIDVVDTCISVNDYLEEAKEGRHIFSRFYLSKHMGNEWCRKQSPCTEEGREDAFL